MSGSHTSDAPVTHPELTTRSWFEAIFRDHYPYLCAFAKTFLETTGQAEDAVQEVMFRLWKNRESIRINTSLRAYLCTAVRNHCLNEIRHEALVRSHAGELRRDPPPTGAPADQSVGTGELSDHIRGAINRLPEKCREVFILSRYHGLPNSGIANQLGISVKTVENQMTRALRSLRADLKDFLPLLAAFFVKICG